MIAIWVGLPVYLKLQTRMNCVSQSQKNFTYSLPDGGILLVPLKAVASYNI
jgi:hypothetical protein